MRVYVESNFPLELARFQEEATQTEEILRHSEAGEIQLIFPAIAITEPFSALNRHANERARFLHDLERQLSDLSRSRPHRPLVLNLNALVSTLTKLRTDESDRLDLVVERMLKCGRSIPLTEHVFARARQAIGQFDLTSQDAIMFASVITDLETQAQAEDACFVSKNSNDFSVTKAAFSSKHCRYIAKFAHAFDCIRATR